MRIAALFRRRDLPIDEVPLLLHLLLHRVKHADRVAREHGDLAVLHIRDSARMLHQRRHVRGDEIASLAVAQQQRRVLAGGVDAVRLVGAENAEGICALDAVQDHVQRVKNALRFVIIELQ